MALLAQPDDAVPRIDIAWNTNLAYLQADATLADLNNRTLALGSRDSGHAAILPVHFLDQQGMREGRDYRTLRFDSDVGKYGDTGMGEVEVVRVLEHGSQRTPGARRRPP